MPKNAKNGADGSPEAIDSVGALGRGSKSKRFGRLLQILGPGLVAGAADDDPSGVATCSRLGLWVAFGVMALAAIALLISLI